MANKSTQFSADRQPKNRRGKSKSTLIEEALKRKSLSVDEFYDNLLTQALGGEVSLMREVLIRLHPTSKQTAPLINFQYPENGTPVEKIDSIIHAVSSGEIPSDIGKQVVDIIKIGIDVQEVTELMERVSKLEKMISGGGANVQSADE